MQKCQAPGIKYEHQQTLSAPLHNFSLVGEINDQLITQTKVNGTCDLCLKGQVQGTMNPSNREYYGPCVFVPAHPLQIHVLKLLILNVVVFRVGSLGNT